MDVKHRGRERYRLREVANAKRKSILCFVIVNLLKTISTSELYLPYTGNHRGSPNMVLTEIMAHFWNLTDTKKWKQACNTGIEFSPVVGGKKTTLTIHYTLYPRLLISSVCSQLKWTVKTNRCWRHEFLCCCCLVWLSCCSKVSNVKRDCGDKETSSIKTE